MKPQVTIMQALKATYDDLFRWIEGITDRCVEWKRLYEYEYASSAMIVVPGRLRGGDFSESLVDRANYDRFIELFGGHPDVFVLSGDEGRFGIAILATCTDPDIISTLDRLQRYPVLCEATLAALEDTARESAWERWVKREFLIQLARRIGELLNIAIESVEDFEDCRKFFEQVAAASDTTWDNTCGQEMTINVERILPYAMARIHEEEKHDGRSACLVELWAKRPPAFQIDSFVVEVKTTA